jgi:nucleotide-binding universal stress UspA family protein
LRHAGAIASWYGAALHVLHVIPDPAAATERFTSAGPGDAVTQMRTAASAALQEFVDEADLSASVAGLYVRSGSPAREIVQYANDSRPDLLVLGTHGRTGWRRLLIGSTAELVVAHATCPVMTIPPHAGEVQSPVVVRFKRILAACDFSAASDRALEYGVSLAQENGASLTLLHVIDTVQDASVLAAADQRTIEYIDQRRRDARAELRSLAARDTCEACETCVRVELGAPARTILAIASDITADLIVMGTQGHGPLGVMLFGSATQAVLRHATCPVLTARAVDS